MKRMEKISCTQYLTHEKAPKRDRDKMRQRQKDRDRGKRHIQIQTERQKETETEKESYFKTTVYLVWEVEHSDKTRNNNNDGLQKF